MIGKTLHVDRSFIRLYLFAGAWALFGMAIPALARGVATATRGVTVLGVVSLLGGILGLVLGMHPRTARDLDQGPVLVSTYPIVLVVQLLLTAFVGWLTGAIHNVLWLVYFLSLLLLDGVALAALVRLIRRPPPSSQGPGTQSSQGPAPRPLAGQGIVGRPKGR